MKGPMVTKGYYGNAQANEESFIDGWFCTGDIGIWKKGLPYIVDRKKVGSSFMFSHILLIEPAGTHKIQRHPSCSSRPRSFTSHTS